MRKAGINQTREDILKFIQSFIHEKGYAPTVRDILKGCQLNSTAVVQHHLKILERQGRIHRDPQVVRSIQLAEREMVEVPLLGTIAAGKPIPVPDSDSWSKVPEEMLRLTADIVGNRQNVYALRVKGSSMLDALINDGDFVIMEAARSAGEGEMVAAWLKDEQEVTLKKIYREPKRIRLQPANKTMQALYTRPENVEVQGRVLAVIRRLAR